MSHLLTVNFQIPQALIDWMRSQFDMDTDTVLYWLKAHPTALTLRSHEILIRRYGVEFPQIADASIESSPSCLSVYKGELPS